MRAISVSICSLFLLCAAMGCEKNVQEVRRSGRGGAPLQPGEPSIVAPGGLARTTSANSPAAPGSGEPRAIGAAPRSPTDRR